MKLQLFVSPILVAAAKNYLRLPIILSVGAIAFGPVSTALAANYNDFVAQGYRWVTVDGPYGCPVKADLQQITKNRTEDTELAMVEQLRAYYLIPGNVVRIVQEDKASGMSQIRAAGIVRDLWTFTKFLSRRPIRDTYGVIETPEIIDSKLDDHSSRYGSRLKEDGWTFRVPGITREAWEL
jgi:hypothetical protein